MADGGRTTPLNKLIIWLTFIPFLCTLSVYLCAYSIELFDMDVSEEVSLKIIKEANNHWATDEQGNFLLKNSENDIISVEQNNITFNQKGIPFLKVGNESIKLDFEIIQPTECAEEIQIDDYVSPIIEATEDNTEDSQIIEGDGDLLIFSKSKKNSWNYDNTRALITAVEDRYEQMYHPLKKKSFWADISEVLLGINIEFDASTCKKKWDNLKRTYNNTKDLQNRSGRGASRFQFFDRMNELLGDKPSNSSPHTVDVNRENARENVIETILETAEDTSTDLAENTSDTNIDSKKKTNQKKSNPLTAQYIKIKQNHYAAKEEATKKKNNIYKNYLDQVLQIKRRRLELEEKRVQLLQERQPKL